MQHLMAYRAGKARARRGVAGCGLRWLAALLLAIGAVGPVWASCPSTVTLSVPAGGSIALDCSTDGGIVWGFTEIDGSHSVSTTYGHVSLYDPAHDIWLAGYFNTSGAGQTDTFDLTDGGTGLPVHFIINIGPGSITLDPASLPNPTVGVAYSQTVTASGGTEPYTFSMTAGALPAGLSLASDGTLSGTPSANGTFNFTVQAQDANSQVGTRAYNLTVSGATLTLAPSTLPDGAIGVTYSQSFGTTGGVAPYSYAITTGALPAGLALVADGTLSGTPTVSGTFNFDVQVSDSSGGTPSTATVSYGLVIAAPTITVSPATLPAGQLNSAYSATISAGGGTAPYSFTISTGALPAGLSLASDGTLSGTPTASGTFNFDVTATDATGGTGPFTQTRSYTLQIDVALPVANPVSATVTYGSGANPVALDITGGAPTSVAIGTAASHGSALASGTSITYQPAVGFAGSDSFTYTASNASGTSTPATVSITVSPPTLSLSPAAGTLTLDYNVAYSQTFSASGGATPYSYTLTGTLPSGLSFDAASGTLSGTPTQSGSFPVTVTATDSSTGSGAPFSMANNYTLQANSATIAITPATLPAGTAGDAYSQSLAASGGIGPYAFSVTAGALPAGLSLASDGTLSGTPSASGTFAFTVQAQDANSQIGTRAYSLSVSGATLTLAPSTLPNGAIGVAYSQSLSATGGITPYSYTVTAGALPTGLALAVGGTLSGTPTAGGTFNFDVQVSDSSGGTPSTATVSYALVIDAPTITLSPSTLPDGQLNSAYSATISAAGGIAPYDFAIGTGALPAGLSLASNGTLSGTPAEFGTFNFTVSATDSSTGSGPYGASHAYTLTIADMAVVANPVSATVAYGSGANPISLDITGGTPTAVAIGTAASHGSALASGTSITYQPNAGFAGSDSFTYTASNAGGTSAPATVSITVSSPTLSLTPAAGTLALAYNTAYSQTFGASGGAAPYSYALTGTLPAGLSFATASGTLSGTPTQSGSFPVTVTATDSSTGSSAPFSVANNYTLQVNPTTLAITPATLPTGTAGDAYSQSLAASGGIGPYAFSVTAGTLPTGLNLAGDGTLSGTPSASGTFAFTVQAQDANSQVGTLAYNLTVSGATLTLAPSTLPNGAIGAAYSQSFSITGGVAPYSYALTAGALPAGLSLAADGSLAGTPTAGGTFHFDVQASDSSGGTPSTATVSYALVIAAPAITLSPATLPAGQLSSTYSAAFSAGGGTAPYTYALASGTLPAGLSLASDGTLSGTPTVFGTFNFTVSATDSSTGGGPYSASQAYTLTIADMAVVANPVSATVAYGSGANPISLDITGGTPTAVAIGTAASHGSALASGTSITYQPNAGFAGSDSFTYTASNASGTSAPATVSITVSPPMLSLTPAAGTLTLDYNVAYSQDFSASGGAAPYSYALAGTLPVGLSFTASGTLSGTPTQSGSFPVTVTATDSSTGSGAPFSVANNYTLQVNPATITITPAALPAGTAGSVYSQNLAASGGIGPYTFSVTAGALPAGLSLAGDGTLSGTPSANGTFAFTVQAQDANGQTKTHAYNLAITAATLTLTPATLPPGVGSVPYSQSFSTTGGVAPYSYALTAGALPAGLTLVADGSLSGTPTTSGTFHFDVQVSDSSGGTPSSATVSYALVIAAPTITVTPPELPAGIIGTHYAQALSASGGIAPYSYTISAGGLPGGVALATDGRLSGTLTASGRFAFTVRAQDTNGFSGTRDYSLVIEVRSDPSKDPEVLGLLTAQTTAARRFAQAQIGNFQQRLESLHAGGGAGFANGFTVPMERPCRDTGRPGSGDCGRLMFTSAWPVTVGPLPAAAPTPKSSPAASSSGPFGLWTGGALRFGDYDARRGHDGFEFETTGISAGADYRAGPTFTFGGGIGYGHDRSDIGDNGSRSVADSYSVAMYASYHPGKHVYLDGLLGYQWLSFQSRRYVTDNGNRVHGERDGTQWFVSTSGGYETRLERLGIASYARLDLARATIDGYTEQGDNTYDLIYRSQDIESITTSLGMRLDYQYQLSWGALSPQLRLEYQHDFQDESIAAMRYADLVGPLYRAGIKGFDRNRVLVGVGAQLYTDNDFGLHVEYSNRFSSGSTSEQMVLLNIEKRY